MISLTAVIPIGNTQGNLFHLRQTLSECLMRNVNVVLVHDDFQDGTALAIENLRSEYPWIDVVSGFFRSPGKARNAGMKMIATEWFCFWDVDDIPNVRNISDALNRNGNKTNIIVGTFAIQDFVSNQVKIWPYPRTQKNVEVEIAINPGLWRFVFNTGVYGHCRFEDFIMGEDQLFLAQARIKFTQLEIIDEIFYTYITNQNNQLTSEKSRTLQLNSVIQSEDEITKYSQNSVFVDFLILKQSLTLMHYGFFQDRRTICAFFKAILRLRLKVLHFLFVLTKIRGRIR